MEIRKPHMLHAPFTGRSRSGRAGQARPARHRMANPPLPAPRLFGVLVISYLPASFSASAPSGHPTIPTTIYRPHLGRPKRYPAKTRSTICLAFHRKGVGVDELSCSHLIFLYCSAEQMASPITRSFAMLNMTFSLTDPFMRPMRQDIA